jgi:hypothetical protein
MTTTNRNELTVIETKVSRNYTIRIRKDNNGSLVPYNNSLVTIINHTLTNGDVEYYADVITEGSKTFLVYEYSFPASVQRETRAILLFHGYKWNRTVFSNLISNWIRKAYDNLNVIVNKKAFNKPYSNDWRNSQNQYRTITGSKEYIMYKNNLDHNQLETEQYEEYYSHVSEYVNK